MPTDTCNRVLVERYALGEGGLELRQATRRHVDACAACRGLLTALETERRDYLTLHPFREFSARHLDGHRPVGKAVLEGHAFLPRWVPALAGLATCLLILPLVQHRLLNAYSDAFPNGASDVDPTGIRGKGVSSSQGPGVMEYFFKRDGQVRPGGPGEAYRSGDELQFVYAGGGYAYVSLVSIDSRGAVSLYREAGATSAETSIENSAVSVKAKNERPQPLPFGVTLDDSPGSEFFVMVFSAAPIEAPVLQHWLEDAYTKSQNGLEGLSKSTLTPPVPKARIKTLLMRKDRV